MTTLGARGFSCTVSGLGRRRVSLRSTKFLVAREKTPLVPRDEGAIILLELCVTTLKTAVLQARVLYNLQQSKQDELIGVSHSNSSLGAFI